MIKKTVKKIDKTQNVSKDSKRERQLAKMLEKKKKLAKAKELVFNLNPIKVNWKKRIFKRSVFRFSDLMTSYFVRMLDFDCLGLNFGWVFKSTKYFGHQTVCDYFKMYGKKIRAFYLSLTIWLLAINLRKEPNLIRGVWLNVLYTWFVEIVKIIFLLKLLNFSKNHIHSKYKFKVDWITRGHKTWYFSNFIAEFYKKRIFGKIYIDKSNEYKLLKIPYFWGHLRIFRKFMFSSFTGGRKSLGNLRPLNDNLLRTRINFYEKIIYNHKLLRPPRRVEPNLTSIIWIQKKTFLVLYSSLDMKLVPPT